MNKPRALTEAEKIQLEALVKSPVYGALKVLLDGYRHECLTILTTSKDTHKIFETQGRLIGLNVIENLPAVVVRQLEEGRKKDKEEEDRKEAKSGRRAQR